MEAKILLPKRKDNLPVAGTPLKVFNIIILDESGSMQAIYDAALNGCNEVLQAVKSSAATSPELEHWVQLITFDSRRIKHQIPISRVNQNAHLSRENYQPGTGTPLFDAIGYTLTPLEMSLIDEPSYKVVVSIITDGYENASIEYTQEAIKVLIKRLRNKGWEIIFMGANQDVEQVASSLNIDKKIKFKSTHVSTSKAFNTISQKSSQYFNDLKSNRHAIMDDFNFDAEKG